MSTTVDSFLEDVKRRITVPANQALLSSANILVMSDKAMREKVVPALMKVRQNFFLKDYTETLVADQAAYGIPYRSIGRTLHEIKLRHGTALTSNQSNLAQLEISDLHNYSTSSGVPEGFYFRGDKVVLSPAPVSASYQMLGWYPLQPSRHCLVEDAALVVSIAGSTVTCSNVPATMIAGAVVDFVQAKSGSSILSMDIAITGINTLDIVFATGAVPTDLVAGDYISIKQTSPVIQLPDEAIPLLELWTCHRVLGAISDFEGMAALKGEADMVLSDLTNILNPRMKSEPVKIMNRNGLLRGRPVGGRFKGFTP